MPRMQVSSGSPWEPVVGFSRAVRVGDQVFVAGTGPVEPDGGCAPDATGQLRRCFAIIEKALVDAGASLEHLVRTRMYLTDTAVVDEVGAAHHDVIGHVRPAATMVIVSALADPRWVVEVEAEAVID